MSASARHLNYRTQLTRQMMSGEKNPTRDFDKNLRKKGSKKGRPEEFGFSNKRAEAVRNWRRNTMSKGDRNKQDNAFTVPGSLNSHKGYAVPKGTR